DGDDMALSDKDGRFAIFDDFAVEAGGSGDHEQLFTIDIDLQQLVGAQRVFDGQRMQVIGLLKGGHFVDGRIDDADPDEGRFVVRAVGFLVDCDAAHSRAILVKIGGYDSHHASPSQVGRLLASVGQKCRAD